MTTMVRTTGGPAAGWSLERVKSTLRRLIQDSAGISATSIHDDSTFDGDLAMDSLSFIYLQVAVEQALDVPCDPLELAELNRFDAVAALLFRRLGQRR